MEQKETTKSFSLMSTFLMLSENIFILRRRLWELVDPKMFLSDIDISDFGGFIARFFALDNVCMVWCDRPAAFMRLYKPHTIEDNSVLCHATVVVSGINLLKSRGISAYWRACALYACMVITCSRGGSTKYSCHSCSSWSTDQGKLLIAYLCSRLRIWSRETGSDVPSRASQLYTHTEPESMVRVPTGFLPFSPASCQFIQHNAISHRANPEFIGSRN